jgi:hypothetical protein
MIEVQEAELEIKALTLESEAKALVIVTEADYRAADRFGRAAKALLAEIDAAFDPIIDAAHKSHKTAIEQKKKQSAPVEAVKRIVSEKMGTWYRAEQARAAEERRVKEAEARRIAEEAALKVAEALAAEGMHEAADMAMEAPVVVERVAVTEAPKLEGVSYRETWSADLLSLPALVKAAAADPALVCYLEANMVALNQAARIYKNTVAIPGVAIKSETVQARR